MVVTPHAHPDRDEAAIRYRRREVWSRLYPSSKAVDNRVGRSLITALGCDKHKPRYHYQKATDGTGIRVKFLDHRGSLSTQGRPAFAGGVEAVGGEEEGKASAFELLARLFRTGE